MRAGTDPRPGARRYRVASVHGAGSTVVPRPAAIRAQATLVEERLAHAREAERAGQIAVVPAADPGGRRARRGRPRPAPARTRRRDGVRPALPLVAVGLVGALGFAAEHAHQSWSAIFLADEPGAGPAPAASAVFAALTRFAAGALTRISAEMLLVAGAAVVVLGTLLVSAAPDVPVALAGLAIAAIGTSVLVPTLLSRATRDVPASRRGRATSAVATTAYLGFVLGPVCAGLLAGSVGLRGAMVAVAALVGSPRCSPRS